MQFWLLRESEAVEGDDSIPVTFICGLDFNVKTVNCVRFSHGGKSLVLASVDGIIVIITPKDGWTKVNSESSLRDFEFRTIRGRADIQDICWSPDDRFIAAGSVDNMLTIYNVQTARMVQNLNNHSHFVQGVSKRIYI